VSLRGEKIPGTEDGPGPVRASAAISAAWRRVPLTCGCGPADLAAAARPSGLPPERARHGRRPGIGQLAHRSPAVVLAMVPVSVTHSRSMSSRPCLRPGQRPGAGAPKARPWNR